MTATLLLRIASVLAGIHGLLHTIGGVFGKPAPGAQETTVAIMKANQFPVMGLMRSYGDFYLGFGLFVTIALLAEAVVFWQLSGLMKSDAARLRPLLGTFLACYASYAAIAFTYFFPPPGIMEILIAACLGLAILRSKIRLAGV